MLSHFLKTVVDFYKEFGRLFYITVYFFICQNLTAVPSLSLSFSSSVVA